MRRALGVAASALVMVGAACTASPHAPAPVVLGAMYPLSGSQGPGGVEEYHGVALAARMANELGGIHGRLIKLDTIDVPGPDAAAPAIDRFHRAGIQFVLGSYGSVLSYPASQRAEQDGMLFWETGAVGQMPPSGTHRLAFRVPPGGDVLGSSAVSFVANELLPKLHRSASSLRWAVANVDDFYGSEVAKGAVDEIRSMHLPFAGDISYSLTHFDPAAVTRQIAATHPDVLFVSAYLQDGVALRQEAIRQHLHLVTSIGTSSSYCMPAFGATLREGAVGLFASDKPDADSLNVDGLLPAARTLFAEAGRRYKATYGAEMSAAALAGFSAAWALFDKVMPAAGPDLTAASVAAAAQSVRLPMGSLPNGSGLQFGPPGTALSGANIAAASVIEEWVGVNQRSVVWPPRFAQGPIRVLPVAG